ncbi:hypothetical protein BEH_07770 [Priestia filamentosa]|uniref:Uncharacterized protein n=1 Tax=Priestia filamentosa TaxID=1402861 RepID=A0A0H4KD11_9BACI|nr:hypothetical protein [Priestia filamentosa]AKO92007.1 hypothetical protein BEH_07770 [Priestia filamentosa]
MKLKVKENKEGKLPVFECGDIITMGTTSYIIISTKDGFIAKNLDNGLGGATGYHKTLEELINSINKYEHKHYSKDSYELVLQQKEN